MSIDKLQSDSGHASFRTAIGNLTKRYRAGQLNTKRTKRFFSDCSGGIVTAFGLGLPLIASAAVLTVDLASIASSRARLQTIADQAALMGAREMQLRQEDENVLASAVTAYTISNINAVVDGNGSADIQPDVEITVDLEKGTTHVVVTAQSQLIMADKLNPQFQAISVEAEARAIGASNPICLVTTKATGPHAMHFKRNSRVVAPGCSFYSNSTHPNGIFMQGPETIDLHTICSSGGIQRAGHFVFSGTAEEDCPTIDDPLRDRQLPVVGQNCDYNNLSLNGSDRLNPGTYCGTTRLFGSFHMNPGTYNFQDGRLHIVADTHLWGQDVHLHFSGSDPRGSAVLVFERPATIELWAPRTGPAAGLLITGDRDSQTTQRYRLLSDNTHVLEGTIYLPRGKLEIGSSQPISRDAHYTIVVAEEFELDAGPNMSMDINVASIQFNTDYHLSDVPVPSGLGPSSHLSTAQIMLTR